ncbi:GMC family oxidoreductase [Mycolicibacterium austroafricanum]|uniref:GMC family oxidoreductase n=1 Tax=Mycolicibacterium austroafricanum TaxID=39687 RepID=A0ABT8HAH9_MYCAO|nr:GMC family oxidoreductase [Mycolicibacterium austroafricanum]MDN4517746.1 GMC family oxidoreductase [Mycolicibacterium austroafricanum]PQP45701.1 GMC family oxidoreductase [Mycolicibacterium austroafricanum]QRZ08865.1 GMC family oxidoreductase [Mycolicibacterium austroafricanum]QZT70640.1 GMC family oxidoreductase [Mycolicibacterium austroafricanum]
MTKQGGTDADVLIVGAGASGSVAALELVSRGFRVVCLEQGEWALPDDFPAGRPEWELARLKQWNSSPNVRAAASDYPVDSSESPIEPLMFNGVGGSTILYAGHWVRALPSDFRVKTLDGVADDWPLTYEDLRPFYDELTHFMGVSGLAGDPSYPDEHTFPLPPLPIGKYGLVAAHGMEKLGWHWWPGPNAIASRPFKNRPACMRYGACESGCPTGAKASTDFTHWRDAIAAGAVLVTGARVSRLTMDANGLVTGAEYLDRDGNLCHQAAGVTVLAANGIGTPRLLLNSATLQHPDGVANTSGLVGKRLMCHPLASVYGVYDEDLGSHLGPTGQSLQSLQFYETDTDRGFVRGGKWNLMSAPGLLRHNQWEPGQDWRDTMGPAFHDRLRRIGRYTEWGVTIEDLPEEHNEVVIDPDVTDSDGIPAPKMRYVIGENSRRMIDYHLERMSEAHLAAGAVSLDLIPVVRESGWHLLGTARMGTDPATSVVDQFCRSHDVPNLFVIDGSVFVTSTGVNPTATIMAIALRAMRHLAENRSNQVTAS